MTNAANNNSVPRSGSPQPGGSSDSPSQNPSIHKSHSSETYANSEYSPHEAPEADRQDSNSSHESEN